MPNISITVWKHWNVLNISKTFQGLLQEEPITAFKRNRNLKEIIESNCIENGKVIRAKNTFTVGKCSSCLSKTGNLCCSQLTSTTTFISKQTKRKFKIYLKVHTHYAVSSIWKPLWVLQKAPIKIVAVLFTEVTVVGIFVFEKHIKAKE